ncbi:MAG: response regulator [Rhodobacteraceae bacterium]|nr:response regulator [Paracoccaceae bacterium]
MSLVQTRPLKDSTILLIEDERIIAEHVTRMLSRAGVGKILHVRTAEEAWEKLFGKDRQAIHCLIVDLILPGVNGATLIQKLRETKQPAALAMPIVVLTGRNDVNTFKSVSPYRIGAYLIKPCSDDQLRKAVEDAMGGRIVSTAPQPTLLNK